MNRFDYTFRIMAAALVVLLAAGPFMPQWVLFLITISFGKGLVVLGLLLLLRTGLVSFGQGLYYCLGAYTAGSIGLALGINDAVLSLLSGALMAGLLAFILGFLLAGYRGIFFAMLSLAFSMILYGILVKTAMLGSTDGFNVAVPSFFGTEISGNRIRYAVYVLACLAVTLAGFLMNRYLKTPLGRLSPAIKDNELRVEYMGASVRRAIHIKYVLAATLAGLGGALTAVTVGHIDPEMAYWTTSGEFVFITILGGTGSVLAPFLGALIFESIRSFAYEYSPNTWQMVLGSALLLVILFMPAGLWSVFNMRRREV
ncbi:MAG: branched-chain amino acid ABC transporter permease [Pseudomonadota bacterium]|nr:branched-chain amino acid ABC transporter permease [Pseudomonadota bacterium]MBU1569760.1 branched-chain amino acid ABC transporter permease [Pseudomonadota bacterium]